MPRVNRAVWLRRPSLALPIGGLCLFAFLLLALLLTWPLAAHIATHVPGDGIDDPSLAWNLWWAKHALVDQPQNPFAVRWQFWPVGINLAFYTLTVLNGVLGIPLQLVFGLIPAYNLLLLSSFALGGFGAYLLCLDALRAARGRDAARSPAGRTAAFLGAALFAFASPKLFYAALGQGNIARSQWMPFAALYILRAARPTGRARDAALAALFVALQAYAELTYATFLALFAALAALWGLIQSHRGFSVLEDCASDGSLRADFGTLRVGSCAHAGEHAARPARRRATSSPRAAASPICSPPIWRAISLPTQLHPVFGEIIRSVANDSAPRPDGSQMPVNKGQQIYVGYVALMLAGWALMRRGAEERRGRGETWFWAASAVVFFVLTLGPSLRVLGYDLGIPLPFALLARLPFFEGNRYPSRYSVMLLVSLAPSRRPGGVGRECRVPRPASRVPGSRFQSPHLTLHVSPIHRGPSAPGGLWLRFTSHALSSCSPRCCSNTSRCRSQSPTCACPPFTNAWPRRPGDFALLELPPGWRNGARVAGKKDIVIMQQLWNQSAHGKRVLGGNTSRNPDFKFQYFSEDPTLARLIAQTNAADVPQHDALRAALAASPITPADQERARALAAFLEIRYVMVHRDVMPADTETALRDLLPVELAAEEGPLALYRVTPSLTDPTTFAVGTDAGRMALAEGWSPPALEVSGPAPAVSGPVPETDSPDTIQPQDDLSPVFAQRQETRLLLPLPPDRTRVRLRMGALAPDQTVALAVDGRAIPAQPLSETPGWIAFDIPADADRPRLSDVRMRFGVLRPIDDLARTLSRAGTRRATRAQRGRRNRRLRPHLRERRGCLAEHARLQPRGAQPVGRARAGSRRLRYARRSRGLDRAGRVGRCAARWCAGGRGRARRGQPEPDRGGRRRLALPGCTDRPARPFPLGPRLHRRKG